MLIGSNWGKLSIVYRVSYDLEPLELSESPSWSSLASHRTLTCPAELRLNDDDVSVRQEQAKRVVFYDAVTRLIRQYNNPVSGLSLRSPPDGAIKRPPERRRGSGERTSARPVQDIVSLGSNCT
jgi:hypothetical protein